MKRLSDYTDGEEFDLWIDLFDYLANIASDKQVLELFKGGHSAMHIVRELLRTHKSDIRDILLRIDDTPLDGLTLPVRAIDLVNEIQSSPILASFFHLNTPKNTDESSGGATEITEGENE